MADITAIDGAVETRPKAKVEPTSSASASFRPRLEGLTTLRFFAALHVILFHLKAERIFSAGLWWYKNFAGIGYMGVNFFFVLSGFILIYTYSGVELSARQFWQARFARIYPAYLFSLALTAPFFFSALRHLDLPFFEWSERHLALASVLTLLLLQSWIPQGALTWNAVCWSLSVEAFFYALFPFLLPRMKALSFRRLPLWIGGISLVSLIFSVGYILIHPDGAAKINSSEVTLFWRNVLSFNPLVRLPEFLVGMLAGQLFLSGTRNRKLGPICVLTGIAVIALITILAARIPSPMISAGFLSPAFAAIIYGLALEPRWAQLLAFPPLVVLGEASYSLYLLHSFVMTKVFWSAAYLPFGLRVLFSVGAAIGVSVVVYALIEKPARRFLRPKRTRQFIQTRPLKDLAACG